MKHKMWSRLLSMMLAVMMIASIVPNSAFAEAASEIAASSQAAVEVVEETEEVTLPEDTTTEEPAAEIPAEEPAAETPAEEPVGEPAPTEEPVAEPTAEPVTESEQPAAEPTQAPVETVAPSEEPSAEPTAAPEATEAPNASAQPSETPAASATPAPSESPVPSETPVPTETPAPSEEPAIDGQALLDELMAIEDDEAFLKAVSELTEEQTAALEALGEEALAEYTLRVESLTAQEETVELNAEAKEFTTAVEGVDGVTVTVKVPQGALPVDAELKADLIGEDSEEYAKAEQALEEQKEEEYDGMFAMDIRFEVGGQEVEPLKEVEVSIDAQALLPEEADPETVAVQHLKEDATGEVVAVETVADTTEQTDGEVTVEVAEAEEPAMAMASTFAVDGFSVFTITWITKDRLSGGDKTYSITFDIVDTDGNPLEPEGENLQIDVGTNDTKYSFAEALADIGMDSFVASGKEYIFQSAVYIDDGGVAHSVSHYARVESNKIGAGMAGNPKHVLRLYDSVFNHDTTGFYSMEGDANVRLIYREVEDGDAGEVQTETELQRTKQVTKNKDGTYNLELSIAGEVGSITDPAKLDIAFVIDISNSMDYYMDDQKRIEAVGDAVEQMVKQLSQNEKIDVRYSMVHFSSGISDETDYYNDAYQTRYWTRDGQTIIDSATRELTTSGGTNYQAGLLQVRSLMLDARPDAQKYVIFLSDGAPTYHYNDRGETNGNGSQTSGDDKQYAYNEARKLTNLNGFYSIRVGNESGADSILQEVCNNAYAGSSGAYKDNFKNYQADNVGALLDVFAQIEGNITHLLCKNVTVTDPLSDFVQVVAGEQPHLTVTDEDGNPVTVSKSDVWESYDSSKEELKINFRPEYQLQKGYTYKVSLKIEPSQAAYDEYAKSGKYPHTGDTGTGDYEHLPGFYSNEDATVTYTYNGMTQNNAYPKPVVQLEPQTLTIEKTITGLEGGDLDTLENKLKFNVSLNGTVTQYDLSEFRQSGNVYTLEISNLMPGTAYEVTEEGEGMEPLYNVAVTKENDSGNIARGENKATFTNAYEPAVGDLTITKTLKDDATAEKRETFLFQITGADKTYYASVVLNAGENHNDTVVKNLPAGSYTVQEVSCPKGYAFESSNPADGKVTVSGAGASIGFVNTVTTEPDDPTKDEGTAINSFVYEDGWTWTWTNKPVQ